MRYWTFNDYDPDAPSAPPVTLSEDEILEDYWPWWCQRMHDINKGHLISKENCISDWVVVNWAWETDAAGRTCETFPWSGSALAEPK
jgi:hypothetical protein